MSLEKGHGRVETALEWEQSARLRAATVTDAQRSACRQRTDVTIGF